MAQLSGTTDSDASTVAIDTVGLTDWIRFVGNANTDIVRKSGGGSLISTYTLVNGATDGHYNTTSARTVSWSGGTPTASGSDNGRGGAEPNGTTNAGISITVPADTAVATLDLFFELGASSSFFNYIGTLTATLSDGSASPYTVDFADTSGGGLGGNDIITNVHLTFQAASAGQTLTVTWLSGGASSDNQPFPRFTAIGLTVTGGAAPDQPYSRRRRPEETPDEPPRRRLFAPILPAAVVDNPPRFRARRPQEETVDDPRRRPPLFPAPTPSFLWWARARHPQDDGPDEPRPRRARAPVVPAVTPDNPPPRASTARARMLADESLVEPDPRARKAIAWPRGSIGITTDASTAAVDLTAIGTSDWRTWVGTATPADAIRKLTGGSQISDWSPFNGSVMSWSAGVEPNVVQWSDGDPVAAGSHSGILFTAATGGLTQGFIWTVPADLTPRTLHLYLDALPAAGASNANILATLSDGSAPDGRVTTLVDGEWNVHITYVAASPGQTLTVYFVGATPSTEIRVRGLALAGPTVPNPMPFIRRLWQRLETWDTEEPRAAKRYAPIPPPVAPDSPQPRTVHRVPEEAPDEPRARRPLAPIVTAATVDNPPPRTQRRREEEPESIIGRVVRKLVPQPAAVVNNPPPRAGRSNWRIAWESWEPVELLRKVYRLVFPGVVSPLLNAPLVAVFDDPELRVDFDDAELTVLFDDATLTVDFDQ